MSYFLYILKNRYFAYCKFCKNLVFIDKETTDNYKEEIFCKECKEYYK